MTNKAPSILLIETSTEVCSVALCLGDTLIDEIISREPRAHAGIISIITQELLDKNKISLEMCDAIAVSEGPGSYTGLRVGVSFAKGLCYGASKPLIGVGSLDLLASLACSKIIANTSSTTTISSEEKLVSDNIITKEKPDANNIITKEKLASAMIVPMIDARRMEVYTASYSIKGERITPVEALVIDHESFSEQLEKGVVVFCGDGSPKVSDIIKHPNAVFLSIEALAQGMIPSAIEKYSKKEFEDVAYFEPFYLKEFIAGISKKNPLQISQNK